MIEIKDAFDGNINEINTVYQIAQQISNFEFIITAINVPDLKMILQIYV